MPLNSGDTLLNGHYRIVGLLGRGGFGYVYRATDTQLGEEVAIKELIPALMQLSLEGDDPMLKRFLAEARATMRLTHDSIVRTHHVFQEETSPGNVQYYIVMELLTGGSLEEWLRHEAAQNPPGALPLSEAVRVAAEICEGLAYAHARGVVHCDLKPANVLFTKNGRARIADFGIAHVSGEMLTRTWHTPQGFVAGTLPYMSPEQAAGVRDEPRIDVYALGAMLYRMLTGRTYLDFDQRETPVAQAENVYRMRREQPAPPSQANPQVPPWLDAVVLKALAKQPEDRFESAGAMRTALIEGWRGEPAVEVEPTARVDAASEPGREPIPEPPASWPDREQPAPVREPTRQPPTPRTGRVDPDRVMARETEVVPGTKAPPAAEPVRAGPARPSDAGPAARAEEGPSRSGAARRQGLPRWFWPVAGLAAVLAVALVVAIASLGGRETPAATPTSPAVAEATRTQAPEAEPTQGPSPDEPTPMPTEEPVPEEPFEPLAIEAPGCDYGGEFLLMEAVDPLTFRLVLCEPDAALPVKLALPFLGIYDTAYLESASADELYSHPVGTGPFQVSEWQEGYELFMERYDGYWGPAAIPELLVFRAADDDVRLLILQADEADGIDQPPLDAETISAIGIDRGAALFWREELSVGYLGLNNRFWPFDDARVRLAIAMAIDREQIVEQSYPPETQVASHVAPCNVPGGCAGPGWHDFDPERARELMLEAGLDEGFETQIVIRDVDRAYLPNPVAVAEAIQAQLAENLNIRAEVEVKETSVFFDYVTSGTLDGLWLLGWYGDYPHPSSFLDPLFGPDAGEEFGEGYPELWEVLEAAHVASSSNQRNEFYGQANEMIRELVPMVPLAHPATAVAFRGDVEGAHPSPTYTERFAVMDPGGREALVWIQAYEPQSLYCGTAVDPDTWRACAQMVETLTGFEVGGTTVVPLLAAAWEASDDLTEWWFTLRTGVRFHDGSALDASDVVASFAVQWDAAHPLRARIGGDFEQWEWVFGPFLNGE